MTANLEIAAPAKITSSLPQPARTASWQVGPRTALGILIVASILLRLGWSAAMGVCNDEAYHYLFTVYPDWSYFDHPPMTMWLEWLGINLCGGWVHPLSLRLAFVLMMGGSTWLMARLTARWYGEWAGFYAALLLNVTPYYGAAGGFALPDPPLLFFGLLTITTLVNALIDQPERTMPWIWVGLAFAGTLVSKYHAIFFPMGTLLYIVATPSARHLLRRPGPYLAIAIGSIGFLPVLIWNAQHDWLSFVFQGSRAVGMQFKIGGVLTTMFGPMVYLFPWTWVLLVGLLFSRLRKFRAVEGIERLLICLAAVPIAVFLTISCVRPMLPHWSLLGFVPLFPLAGAKWAEWAEANPPRVRKWVAGTVAVLLTICGLAVAQGRFGVFQFPFKDPLIEASGWDSVADELKSRGLVGQPNTFLFTDRWYDSGQLAFALRNQAPVLCYSLGDAHGFAQWHDPNDWVGKDGILIATRDCPKELSTLTPYFTRVEFLGEFPMTRGGVPFRTIRVWRFSEQVKPFPFRYGEH